MRRYLKAGVVTAMVGVAVACTSDGSPGSAGREQAAAVSATTAAQTAPLRPDSNTRATQAPLAQTGTAGAPVDVVPPAAAPVRGASGAASPPQRAPRVNGPRHVMLGDLDLTGVGYDAGSVTAPVVLIDFSDFGCPYCAQFTRETYPAIEREYVRTGKVFFTDPRTTRANDVASTIGVRVTPSFLVNDRPVQGALPLADFRKVIDAALLLEAAKR